MTHHKNSAQCIGTGLPTFKMVYRVRSKKGCSERGAEEERWKRYCLSSDNGDGLGGRPRERESSRKRECEKGVLSRFLELSCSETTTKRFWTCPAQRVPSKNTEWLEIRREERRRGGCVGGNNSVFYCILTSSQGFWWSREVKACTDFLNQGIQMYCYWRH